MTIGSRASLYRARQSLQVSARVLLFSMRNLTRHVSRGGGYEFEDVIWDCDDVDMLAPDAYRSRGDTRITRRLGAMLWQRGEVFNTKSYGLMNQASAAATQKLASHPSILQVNVRTESLC